MLRVNAPRELHVAILGSGGVGKSCLAVQYKQGVFVEQYDPTIEDSYRKSILVDGRHVILDVMDTAGTDQYTAMREVYMKLGQGFLLVFSMTSTSSLHELVELREQIVRTKGDSRFPIVLVGNKSDLGEIQAESRAMALRLSQSWGDIPYYETSARTGTDINEVFLDLCRQIIRKDLVRSAQPQDDDCNKGTSGKRASRSKCTIL